jgi:hypothetical protein
MGTTYAQSTQTLLCKYCHTLYMVVKRQDHLQHALHCTSGSVEDEEYTKNGSRKL